VKQDEISKRMTDNTYHDDQSDPFGKQRLEKAQEKKDCLKLEVRILDDAHARDLRAKIKDIRTKYTQIGDEIYRKGADIEN